MRRVVIHLHGSSSDTTSLASAIDFCRKLNARLSVVFIRRTREFIPAPADGIPGAFYETEAKAAPEAERAYREMCDGLSFISYTEADIDSVEMITQNGLLHDLTVVERLTEREGSKVADFNTAVFGTGAPVMITPPAAMATVAETPAVVWNASLPSARAIRSAVPLLRIAKKTTILSSADNPHADPSALARYLDCYGIKCESATFRTDKLTARARGRSMLEAARNAGADLLIMGAFGESKITAMLGLGRATEKVVMSCKVPLLVQA
jgi:nucleotide-binding universal stress UspA family protein